MDKSTFMYEEIHIFISFTNKYQHYQERDGDRGREGASSGRELAVNSRRTTVAGCGICFADSHVFPAV